FVKAPAQIRQRHDSGDAHAHQQQPHRRACPDEYAIDDVRWNSVRLLPVCRVPADHQQLVCQASLAFADNTVPSLVVMEQLSLLTRNRLDASSEPTSDCEIGVTVIDHGMYTLCWVRRRPDAST